MKGLRSTAEALFFWTLGLIDHPTFGHTMWIRRRRSFRVVVVEMMIDRTIQCCLIGILLLSNATAQELLRNGSFEDHRSCPRGFGKRSFKGVADAQAYVGDPTYFHSCANVVGVPENWAGTQAAKEGSAYVGLVLTSRTGDRTDRQFIQLRLAEPLVNGHRYRLSFWVNAAEGSGYSTDRIGARFLVDGKRGNGPSLVGKFDVENPLDRFLADTAAWMKVEGIYHAKGGERSVVIGNFQPYGYSSRKALSSNTGGDVLRNIKRKSTMMNDPDPGRGAFQRTLSQTAYVFVDAVSLEPLTTNDDVGVLTQELACANIGIPVNGKEMVPDVGFEMNETQGAVRWSNASGGTPDFPDGVAGIYLFSAVNKNNREFIRITLAERTDPCATYRFSMRVLRDPSYGYAVDQIGVALVDNFQKGQDRGPLPFPTAWSSPPGLVMVNTAEWITFCGELNNVGCATDLVVGNFSTDTSTTVRTMDGNGGPFAYYFVDDISLLRTGTMEGCTLECAPLSSVADPLNAVDVVQVADPVLMLPIQFEIASTLADTIDPALVDRIHQTLLTDPLAVIKIQGHTDDTGTEVENKKLSLERARVVEHHFVTNGIPQDRLVVEYFGSERPRASNSNPEGRALNRRVEVVVPLTKTIH